MSSNKVYDVSPCQLSSAPGVASGFRPPGGLPAAPYPFPSSTTAPRSDFRFVPPPPPVAASLLCRNHFVSAQNGLYFPDDIYAFRELSFYVCKSVLPRCRSENMKGVVQATAIPARKNSCCNNRE